MNKYILMLSILSVFTPLQAQTDFWVRTNSPEDAIFALCVKPDMTIFAGSSNNNPGERDILLRSVDGGNTWQEKTTGIGGIGIRSIAFDTRGTIWTGTVARGLFLSENNGDTWTSAGIPRSDIPAAVWDIVFNSQGHIFLGGHGSPNLLRSTDFGASWQRIDLDFGDDLVDAFSISLDVEDNLYAGTNLGLFTSNNGGNSWLPTDLDGRVPAVLVSTTGGIWAGTRTTLFNSMDGGGTFQPVSVGIDTVFVRDLLQNSEGSLFLATSDDGILRSDDDGLTWQPVINGLSDLHVWTLAEGPDGFVYAGTETGVYRSRESTVTSVLSPESTQPERFLLQQNYPNPFNPTTNIRYELRTNSRVLLSVYNTIGERVRVLVDELQTAGAKTVVWSGRDDAGNILSSGLYVYEIRSEGLRDSKKMLLLK